jgi:2-dehydro-3-deoxyphosphogluconate aldolase/(4S)-4-hydroxy-2-oxoglutarate aldolase
MSELARALADQHVVAIVRQDAATASQLVDIATALVEAGITVIEFPLTNPRALEAIVEFATRYPTAHVGGGTVLSPDDARRVLDAGGAFIVTPHVDLPTVETAQELGLDCLPGAFTATEIAVLRALDVLAVKVFPAGAVGPSYIAALRGPYPDVQLIPTGGVTVGDAPRYIAAGALAVGLGSDLIGDGSPDSIAARARTLRSEFQRGRTTP